MSSTRKEAVTRCGWCKKGCHVNRDLLFLVEVLDGSSTVSVILSSSIFIQSDNALTCMTLVLASEPQTISCNETVCVVVSAISSPRCSRARSFSMRTSNAARPSGSFQSGAQRRTLPWRHAATQGGAAGADSGTVQRDSHRCGGSPHMGQAASVSQFGGGTLLVGNTSPQVCWT
jgi:hypothetical protein